MFIARGLVAKTRTRDSSTDAWTRHHDTCTQSCSTVSSSCRTILLSFTHSHVTRKLVSGLEGEREHLLACERLNQSTAAVRAEVVVLDDLVLPQEARGTAEDRTAEDQPLLDKMLEQPEPLSELFLIVSSSA